MKGIELYLNFLRGLYVSVIILLVQRLGRLVREGKMVEALKLGLNIHDGRASAVIGWFDFMEGVRG